VPRVVSAGPSERTAVPPVVGSLTALSPGHFAARLARDDAAQQQDHGVEVDDEDGRALPEADRAVPREGAGLEDEDGSREQLGDQVPE